MTSSSRGRVDPAFTTGGERDVEQLQDFQNQAENSAVCGRAGAGRGCRIGRIPSRAHDATDLLQAWGRGEDDALDRLLPLVHEELRRVARRHMRHERVGHTLQASALVNEAYLRLIQIKQVRWQDRLHFIAMASRMMRRVLVESARAKGSQKRGAGAQESVAGRGTVGPRRSVAGLRCS